MSDVSSSPRIAVAGVYFCNGKVLMGRRFDRPGRPGLWEFPGGKVESGEELEEALTREFVEELKLDIVVKRFLGETTFVNKGQPFRLVAFEVSATSDEHRVPEAVEHSEIHWYATDELDSLPLMESDRELITRFRAEGYF